MTKAVLPRTNQTGPNEWGDVEANDAALAAVINGELDNENLKNGAGITRAKLAADAKGVQGTWYPPTIISTEETRSNTAFGTLTTPDQVTGVVVPENGFILVGYRAQVKASNVIGAGVTVYLGANQTKTSSGKALEPTYPSSTEFLNVTTATGNLGIDEIISAEVTTGQVPFTNFLILGAAAGTYTVSIRYKSASGGTISAKNRKLSVLTVGQ